ncbi:hypothetical protein CC85DRAFT_82369 [Cutaneotrichosporon oleaginosum]|uniref:Uncharacterized protein n=1 Tax=Cutaneotrichosporon oleaginosum TaxID=879819 RepID=A0A0J0XNH1_9TREE|nr:uncharacterized protein CC85DRAFT_82369 [Cutaneotrichosporon oleaginosum]KLT42675.1 hypothetical protein CC85DRAFT_82369 [Cutaneotrichosporon oleaginosum]TXT05209.1 hypothetical protein COLE_06529 [Cutaneotrichosporon oleaginosum]
MSRRWSASVTDHYSISCATQRNATQRTATHRNARCACAHAHCRRQRCAASRSLRSPRTLRWAGVPGKWRRGARKEMLDSPARLIDICRVPGNRAGGFGAPTSRRARGLCCRRQWACPQRFSGRYETRQHIVISPPGLWFYWQHLALRPGWRRLHVIPLSHRWFCRLKATSCFGLTHCHSVASVAS